MPISMLWVHTLFDLIVILRTLQIFELEDELDSALDSHEHGVAPPMGRQRTMSTAQSRRPSGHEPRRSSGNGPRSPPPFPRQPPSPQKDGRQQSDAVPLPPRQRVNSVLNRGAEMAHNFASPLAQIFQPLVLDMGDDMAEDEQPQDMRDAISYGPATRRRLTSIARRPTAVEQHSSPHPPPATALRRFPTAAAARPQSPSFGTPISESPDQHADTGSPSETAGQAEEKESTLGNMQWMKRLDEMDARQKRMEEMLLRIVKGLNPKA